MDDLELRPEIHKFLEHRLEDYLEILEKWVAINSFTANRAGVNALGTATELEFARMGFNGQRFPSVTPGFGDHLVLRRKGGEGLSIGMLSHLDTVFGEEEEVENGFRWRRAGARVFGPGTVDIKGGTMLIYMALDVLRQFRPDLFNLVDWKILLDASEETLSDDFGALCLSELDGARACLVFESGYFQQNTFKLVNQRKGMAKFTISVSGRGSHAGAAHAEGLNAIVGISEVIRAIAGLTDYDREITYNIGQVSGGTVANRVPHQAQALGEMRAYDQEIFLAGVERLRDLSTGGGRSAGQSAPLVDVDVFDINMPWPENEPTNELLELWMDTGKSLGYQVRPESRGGLSDGNHTWSRIPTLDGLGPGGGNAHCSEQQPEEGKEQEFIYLPSIIPKTILNVFALIRLIERSLPAGG